MDIPLRVLIIEDSDRDVALEVRTLKAAGYQVTYAVADTAAAMKAALAEQSFDIVISDHDLPQFDAPGALAVLKESDVDIPFIIVSGAIGEENAVALIKAGANNYVMKDRLLRLVPAVQRELQEAESRREQKQMVVRLQESEEKIRNYIESAPDGVFVVDGTGRYVETNKSARLIIGYSKEEIEKMCIHDLLAEESMEEGSSHFKKLAETGMAIADLWHKNKDGSKCCLSVNAVKLSETRFLGFCKDVTEQKQMAEKLKESENDTGQ